MSVTFLFTKSRKKKKIRKVKEDKKNFFLSSLKLAIAFATDAPRKCRGVF